MTETMSILLFAIASLVVACIVLSSVVFHHLQNYHIFLEKLYRPKPAREAIQVVTTADATGVELILFTAPGLISDESAERIKRLVEEQLIGTALEGTTALVMGDGLQAHFIKTRADLDRSAA